MKSWLVFGVLPLLLALVVPAAAGKPPPTRSVPTNGQMVTGLAFDGSRVVYGVRPLGVASQSVHVWNVLSGRTSTIHRRGGGAAFAVAGNRVAWIARGGSPSETDEYLLTTPLPRLNLRQIAFALRSDDHAAAYEVGNWLSGLVGSGNAIAVSSWTTGSDNSVSNGRLSLVTAGRLKPIVSGPEAIAAESLDAGRIAVVRSLALWPGHYRLSGGPGSVGVYSTSGKLLLEVNKGTAIEAALSGNILAVLTTTNRIELYNVKTGAFVRSWRVPAGAAHLDLQAGVAIYAVYPRYYGARALHALGVKTGKDIILTSRVGPWPYSQGDDAQIDRLGIVYAVNAWKKVHQGHIVFVPMARILAAVAKGHVR